MGPVDKVDVGLICSCRLENVHDDQREMSFQNLMRVHEERHSVDNIDSTATPVGKLLAIGHTHSWPWAL